MLPFTPTANRRKSGLWSKCRWVTVSQENRPSCGSVRTRKTTSCPKQVSTGGTPALLGTPEWPTCSRPHPEKAVGTAHRRQHTGATALTALKQRQEGCPLPGPEDTPSPKQALLPGRSRGPLQASPLCYPFSAPRCRPPASSARGLVHEKPQPLQWAPHSLAWGLEPDPLTSVPAALCDGAAQTSPRKGVQSK